MPAIDIGLAGLVITPQGLVWNLTIQAEEVDATGDLYGGRIVAGFAATDPLKNLFYSCREDQWITADSDLTGSILSFSFQATEVDAQGDLTGGEIIGTVVGFASDANEFLDVVISIEGSVVLTPLKKNWVAWSKIGDVRVIADRSNESGERPLEWEGWVYKVMKLGKLVIVYGENGISQLFPVAAPVVSFGLREVHQLGLLDKNSVAGNDDMHFFVDKRGVLWQLTAEGKKELGFEEFLLPLKLSSSTRVVCLYDEFDRRLFISNGSTGFLYREGLGGGYANITGIGNKAGVKFVTAPTAPVTLAAEICTDIIDIRFRGIKTVTMVEVGTDTSQALFVAVDYRYDKSQAFVTSPWVLCNQEGMAFLGISGVEFRIRVRQTTRSSMEIDYINVRYKLTDGRFKRGPLAPMSEV